jgi:ABC-type multidrug transport system fused ATPase/permease subunit
MSSKLVRGLLATYLRPELPRLARLSVILITEIGLQLANPLIAAAFINAAQAGRPTGQLVRIAIAFIGVALVTQLAAVAETYAADDLGWRTTNVLRADLTRQVLHLGESFHSEYGPGQLVERVDGDVSAVADFFSRFVVQVLGNAIFLLGVLLVMFALDWRIGLLMAVFAVVAVVVMTRTGSFVGTRAKEARVAVGNLSGFLEERLGGLVDIKSNGGDHHTVHGLQRHMADRFTRTRSSILAASSFSAGVSLVFVFGTASALALSAALYRSGGLSLGTTFAVFRYTVMLRVPLEQLSRQMNSLQRATGAIVRIRQLLDAHPAVVSGSSVELGEGALGVEFDHVSFAYATEPVLQDVSFKIAPQEVLGVAGRTGSGKTTISRLLLRRYDPPAGAVRVGDVDVRHTSLDDLRQRVAVVTQEVQLFEGSLRDNVTIFDDSVSDDRVWAAFRVLGLARWVRGRPGGLDTQLGTFGEGLSAGEAQLVALARAFLADPGVVILDEASSRLDPATERLLDGAISQLLKNRTGLIIAHRLATLDRADRILILEGGRVVEAGQRSELAADPTSRFSRLQRLGRQESLA